MITNVVSGFQAIGIYLVECPAHLEPISAATALTEESGPAYILLYRVSDWISDSRYNRMPFPSRQSREGLTDTTLVEVGVYHGDH